MTLLEENESKIRTQIRVYVISTTVSLIIAAINFLAATIVNFLSTFEKSESVSEEQLSIVKKLWKVNSRKNEKFIKFQKSDPKTD